MLFRCPLCEGRLIQEGRTLRCKQGHAFDQAKEGYWNLLPVQKKHAKMPGDNGEMIAGRRRFLKSGAYQLFSDGINSLAEEALESVKNPVILDAGCGEGYYTERLRQALCQKGLQPQVAGFDISKFAAKAAAKRGNMDIAVASSFAVPVADHCIDLQLSVFAPIVPQELRRVMKKGGRLILAVPGERHLWGLKEILYENPYPNVPHDTAYEGFAFEKRVSLEDEIHLDSPQAVADLFVMTPYFWKTPRAGSERLQACQQLTTPIAFDLLCYRAI